MRNCNILSRSASFVKAQVVGAGIKFGDLAAKANICQAVLSRHLSGQRKNYRTQIRIWEAFRQLTGQKVSLTDFWGQLLSEKVA